MNLEFFNPHKRFFSFQLRGTFYPGSLGRSIRIHSRSDGLPSLDGVSIAILGVKEDRSTPNNTGSGEDLHLIREQLYRLFPGTWDSTVADLGNILKGNTLSDTYFAVKKTLEELIKKKIIPIILGGGQDVTFSNYKAYECTEQVVNLVTVDSKFDLGSLDDKLSSTSYLSKIIMEKPNNLFNYSNIGYQTYFNSQEQISLIHQLNFDAYRLGDVKSLEAVEPVFRDADIVSIDLGAVRQSDDAPANKNASPNGFNGEEICAIARYAGISDKVSSFGIYEYNAKQDLNLLTARLIAQMIWYFIEGFNFRAKDYPFSTKEDYQKFTVLLDDDEPINFYKSNKTGRWWMEINLISNNKYKDMR